MSAGAYYEHIPYVTSRLGGEYLSGNPWVPTGGYLPAARSGTEVALYLSDAIDNDRVVGYWSLPSMKDLTGVRSVCWHPRSIGNHIDLPVKRRQAGAVISDLDRMRDPEIVKHAVTSVVKRERVPETYSADFQQNIHHHSTHVTVSWFGLMIDDKILDLMIDEDDFRWHDGGWPDKELLEERIRS